MALVHYMADFLGPHRSQSRGNHFLSSKVACLLTRILGLDPLLERTSLESIAAISERNVVSPRTPNFRNEDSKNSR